VLYDIINNIDHQNLLFVNIFMLFIRAIIYRLIVINQFKITLQYNSITKIIDIFLKQLS